MPQRIPREPLVLSLYLHIEEEVGSHTNAWAAGQVNERASESEGEQPQVTLPSSVPFI